MLNCEGRSGINQKGISELKYVSQLNCSDNNGINNVKGKSLFSLQPSAIVMASCQSLEGYVEIAEL